MNEATEINLTLVGGGQFGPLFRTKDEMTVYMAPDLWIDLNRPNQIKVTVQNTDTN